MPEVDFIEFERLAGSGPVHVTMGEREVPEEPLPSLVQQVMNIPHAWAFKELLFPEMELYQWQAEALMQLSGYPNPYDETIKVEPSKAAPMIYTLCAANGSGKDQIVLSIWALFCICCKKNFHWIGTSSSYTQLHEQTWRHIKERAVKINAQLGKGFLKINKHKVWCTRSGSEITLQRTDESGKTEGWHPLVDGGGMAIVLNECKSLEEELVMSYRRCHGWTHWLNVSSPGRDKGYFYNACTKFEDTWPAPLKLGRKYFRRIDYKDCPHLFDEYKRDVEEFTVDSPYIRSSYLALFTSGVEFYLLPDTTLQYVTVKQPVGIPLRAGLDLALGGDATVLSVWKDNYCIGEWEWYITHEPTLTAALYDKINELGIPHNNVTADAANQGTPIIHRLAEMGMHIHGVHNQGAPKNKRIYVNRRAELAFNFRRLVLDKRLSLDGWSTKLRRQATEIMYFINDEEGKRRLQIEDKKLFRGRHGYSPDHFDAAVLAHAQQNHYIFASVLAAKAASPRQKIETLEEAWNAVYGKHQTRAINNGAYRTSGSFAGRQLGRPLQRLNAKLGTNRGHAGQ